MSFPVPGREGGLLLERLSLPSRPSRITRSIPPSAEVECESGAERGFL
jgi:hypothetical protein